MERTLWQLFLCLGIQFCTRNVASDCSISNTISTPETTEIGTPIAIFSPNESVSIADPPSEVFSENYLQLDNHTLILNRSIDVDESCITPQPKTFHIMCQGLKTSIFWVIVPVDEFDPEFPNSTVEVQIPENFPIKMRIVKISEEPFRAIDKDCDSPKVRYYFLMNNHSEFEDIGSSTFDGEIGLAKPLDYEIQPNPYYIYVSAKTEVNISQPMTLIIKVTDVDDMNPYFEQDVFVLNITEEDSGGVGILLWTVPPIEAFDGDRGINDTIEYALRDNPLPDVFSIDPASGRIRLNKTLDRESMSEENYRLIIKAYQTNKPETRTATATVSLSIIDINDQIPEFKVQRYRANIAEHSVVGSFVTTVLATDTDKGENAEFEYMLLEDHHKILKINPLTGEVSVNNSETLDREVIGNTISFEIGTKETLSGRYGGNATLILNILDINDMSPEFLQPSYQFEIIDGDTFVGTVNATDGDEGENGRVNYTLKSIGNDAVLFNINDDGRITVNTVSPLELDKTYISIAEACDNPIRSSDRRCAFAAVSIHVMSSNSTEPIQYSPVQVNMSENTPPGIIHNLDFLSEKFSCKILSCIEEFEIEGRLLKSKKSLDFEDKTSYSSLVEIYQGTEVRGNFTLLVNILDINDNAPIFENSSYVVYIPDNAAVDSGLGNLQVERSALTVERDIISSAWFFRVGEQTNACAQSHNQTHVKLFWVINGHPANDEDSGNNGRILFGIQDDRSVNLGEDTGALTLQKYPVFSTCRQTETVQVTATDSGDPALMSSATVQLYPETMASSSLIVVLNNPSEIDKVAAARNISSILGNIEVTVNKVTRPTLLENVKRSHLHVSGKQDGKIISRGQLNQMIHDSCDKLETLGLMAASISPTGDDDDMPVSAIALIAVAGVILIGSIAAICFICRRYRRYDRGSNLQEKLNQQLEIYETQEIKLEIEDDGSEYDKLDTPRLTGIPGETSIGVVNPAFISETADQEADVQPLDSIESNEPETADVSERDLNSSMSDASDGNCNVGVKDTRVLTSDPTLNASQSELGNPECRITNTDTAGADPQSTEPESSEPEPDYSPQKVRFHEEVLVEDSAKDAPPAVESSDKECEPIYENGVEKSDNEIELPSNSLIVDEENETHTHDGLTVTPL